MTVIDTLGILQECIRERDSDTKSFTNGAACFAPFFHLRAPSLLAPDGPQNDSSGMNNRSERTRGK
jgi:hypothetical protein